MQRFRDACRVRRAAFNTNSEIDQSLVGDNQLVAAVRCLPHGTEMGETRLTGGGFAGFQGQDRGQVHIYARRVHSTK